MSFLSPLAFAVLALAVPLVLLYFLKVRRRQRTVSSVLLWAPALREQQASAFFQRLRRDPLLFLQLLALLLLAVALARPVLPLLGEGERRAVVVLDTSASMKARDVSPSRFDVARSQAAALVRGLGEGAEVMVIAAGTHPQVLAPFARERDAALAALRRAQATDAPARLVEALRTARALAGTDPRTEIHVFTDASMALAETPETTDPRIRWSTVGRRSHNVALTGLSVRKTYAGAYDHQAYVALVNYTAAPQTFPFTLDVDGQTVARRSLTLEPAVRRAMIVPFSHAGSGLVTARLHLDDDLATDNVAHAVLPPPRTIAVTLVTAGNVFLEQALRADPHVVLDVRPPDAYAGGMAGADVVVLDSVRVPRLGPGRFVLVNALAADVPLEVLGRLERPGVVDWDRSHPVMRHVELSRVAIGQALHVRPVGAGRALVDTARGPLVYALEDADRRALFVGFDLFQTDLPLRVAFPMLLSNALRWLHPAVLDQSSLQLAAGEPLRVPVPHGVAEATVTTPGGRTVPGQVSRGIVSFSETIDAGVYTVSTPVGTTRVAVNLMDAEESDLTPRALPVAAGLPPEAAALVPVERELWPLFVLLAALVLGLEAALYWRRQAGGRWHLPGGVDRWALGFRCALLVVLAVALLRPAVPRWIDRLNVVFLVDHSDSVSLAARERAYRFVADALEHRRPDDHHGVIVFGEEAVVDQPLGRRAGVERPQAAVGGQRTNLFQAIQLALASVPPGQASRLVLFTDGRENEGSAVVAAAAARDMGAEIHYVPAPLTFTQEVIAEALVLPEEVRFGESFTARVVVWSQQDTEGRVALYRNGEFLGAQLVRLTAGKNVFAYRQALEASGIHVYQAAIEADGDTIPENNRAVGTVVVRGKPKVLLADKEPAHARSLAAALRSQHLDVTVVPPARIPRDLAGLQPYDGIILSNVSSLQLTRRQMAYIRDYVRDHGGGLMMLGGEESFGLGGYQRTPIEEALPVTMDVKQRLNVPSLAVVVSVDRSGSMAMSTDGNLSRLDLAKEAAHLIVDLLDERNEVGIQTWDTEFVWDVPLGPVADRARVHDAIARIRPGGGTDGYPALFDAYRKLIDSPALLKHIIFVGDGEMRDPGYQELARRMARHQITVSAVAIGRGADVRLLVDIARWGRGRFYYTEDAENIPRIFTLETQLVSKDSLVEQPFRPQLTAPGHEAIQDIDWKSVPPLGGYVATTVKSTADLVLMSHREEPVFATWRYGLGRTAAFTSDAKAKWGVLWVRWPEFNKFWAQATRWTLRRGSRSDVTATVHRMDGMGEVVVDAVDSQGDFINFLDSQVGIVAPDRTRTVVPLEQVAPGRYRGRFPAEQEGVYLVGSAQRRDERVIGSQLAGLVVPYAEELRELGVDEVLLREVADLTGGTALGEPRQVFGAGRRHSRIPVEIWPWLVVAVAVLLVPDVALRRLGPLAAAWLAARRGRRARPE
jgi:Ca-activated chloride channel homolog